MVITQGNNGEQRHGVMRSIGLRIPVLARVLRNNFDRHVGAIGITRSQWALIATVAQHPGTTQRHIADMLEMSEVSAGRLIDRMVMDGMLERRARADDRRAHAIHLTAKVDPLLKRMSAFAQIWEGRMFEGLTETELVTLDHLLGIVYTNCCRLNANDAPLLASDEI